MHSLRCQDKEIGWGGPPTDLSCECIMLSKSRFSSFSSILIFFVKCVIVVVAKDNESGSNQITS